MMTYSEVLILIEKYKRVTEALNKLAQDHASTRARSKGESGAHLVPYDAGSLINERQRLAFAIAEQLSGMTFEGWGAS